MFRPFLPLLLGSALTLGGAITACAADYQFAVDFGPRQRAILWIPPACTQVRGIIYAHQAVLEKYVLDDPALRAIAEENSLAIVQVRGLPGGYFEYQKPETTAVLQDILQRFAEASGYPELAQAPLLPVGHSGNAITAWHVGYWRPQRTIAVVGLHATAIDPPAWDPKAALNSVPVLAVTGEWEMWGGDKDLAMHIDWVRGGLLAMRGTNPGLLQYELVQPGAGHFNYDPHLAQHVADFIRASCALRLPPAGSPVDTPLKSVEPRQGWLGDVTLTRPPHVPLAPYDAWTGDRALAFWYPNEDLARRTESLHARNRGKKPQMLGFIEDGKLVAPGWNVTLKPLVQEDGETVRVQATFVDAWPEHQVGAGTPLTHAAGGGFTYQLIGGWVGGGEQTGPDTFRLNYGHWGVDNGIMLVASHPGDADHGYTEMAATIRFPDAWKEGAAQTIDFPAIPDQPRSSTGVDLQAVSSAGLTVHYAIKNGPARIDGRRLVFTAVPQRTTKPIPVTVLAWQHGRPIEPKVQTAKPVERTFLFGAPAAAAAPAP